LSFPAPYQMLLLRVHCPGSHHSSWNH
jgi:hypothetical protein